MVGCAARSRGDYLFCRMAYGLKVLILSLGVGVALTIPVPNYHEAFAQGGQTPGAMEATIDTPGIFSRAVSGGPVVFGVLMILVGLSITSWAALAAKLWHMRNLSRTSDSFVKSFWDSRSLNDLNSRLAEFPYSPVKEVFRCGYAELVRGSQLRDQASSQELAIGAAIDNLGRAMTKAKTHERRRMEKFQTFLAITASSSPFIGLFGTVWGIMNAFEGIARSGSASLAAVAPGISEALIATAFGLAAAIPAVVAYNIFGSKIRMQMSSLDGFGADFLNIVERYLVTDRPVKGGGHAVATPPHTPTLS